MTSARRGPWSPASARTLVTGLAVLTACSRGEPSGPRVDALPVVERVVGSAPLRRLSNQEYLYALEDLFPTLHPDLPALPEDGSGTGFDNDAEGQTSSDVRVGRYEELAALYAELLTADETALNSWLGCDVADPSSQASCANKFISEFGRKVFRRPLESAELDRHVLRFARWTSQLDARAAVQLSVSAMLQSPQFLYRAEPVPTELAAEETVLLEPFALASRLSFLLWQSVPDAPLLEAAATGQLASREQVRAAAERMLDDPRASRVLWSFHRQWLGLERILDDEHALRTPEVDPSWTPARQHAVSMESRLFVQNILFEGGTLRDLLLSPRAWLNQDLARLYGVSLPSDREGTYEVTLPTGERAGILTRAAFLAGYSHRGATSPPVRANALRLRMLCQLPQSPPPGTDTTPPAADPSGGAKTNRMLFEARTQTPPCLGCHVGLNGLGFGFENFSASGAFVTQDHGLPIDARGELFGTDVDGSFDGAAALSALLSESETMYRCAALNWLRFALGRAPEGAEEALVDDLTAGLLDGVSVRALLLELVTTDTFRYQRVRS